MRICVYGLSGSRRSGAAGGGQTQQVEEEEEEGWTCTEVVCVCVGILIRRVELDTLFRLTTACQPEVSPGTAATEAL